MAAPQEEWLDVLDALLDGDRVALVKVSSVVTGYLARYRAYALRDSWDDLVQDVLVALIKSGREGRIRDARAFVSYVGMVTRNELFDWHERNARPGRPDALGDPESARHALQAALRDERDPNLLIDLERCLEALADRQRRVVEAVYLPGHSYDEAALLLDMPLGSLKREQTGGLAALRECMQAGVGWS